MQERDRCSRAAREALKLLGTTIEEEEEDEEVT